MPSMEENVKAAAELVEQLGGQAAREQDAFELGFRLGYGHGYDVGHAHAHNEIAQDWAELAEKIRAVGRSRHLTFGDLERARYGGPRSEFGKPKPGDYPGKIEGAA